MRGGRSCYSFGQLPDSDAGRARCSGGPLRVGGYLGGWAEIGRLGARLVLQRAVEEEVAAYSLLIWLGSLLGGQMARLAFRLAWTSGQQGVVE